MEKTMKARIQHKHDIEANWLKATNFTPLASEIIVYDPDENYDYPRIKIGDGKTNINALPFVTKDYAKISDIPTKPEDIGALPDSTVIPIVPTKISAFENDKGYLTQHQSLDAYAKTADLGALATKDSLTASEVGALPSTTKIPGALSDLSEDTTHRVVTDAEKEAWNAKSNFSGSYNDLTNKPTIPSIAGLASATYVDDAVKNKVDKDGNKVLSTNDYTTAEKNKLANIAAGAEVNVNADWNATSGDAQILNKPTLVSAFTNDAGYLTEHQSLAGLATESYVNSQIAAIPTPDVSGQINNHNIATDTHNDIRLLINGLTTRLNTLANSDDTTLDQMSEVVAYIKNNKSLIEGVTNNKVNVSDIINNLTTNASNKPLSAAQGVVLKALIDAIVVPTKVSQLENDSKYLTSFTETDPTVPAWAKASSKPSYTKSEVGLGNVDNVRQYSAENPPIVAQATAPSDTSVVWVDTDDNTVDEILDNNLPSYWVTHLDSKIPIINTAMETAGRNKSAFYFYTDAHRISSAGMTPAILRHLYKYTSINKTNTGGDFFEPHATSADQLAIMREYMADMRTVPNHHCVLGNHDEDNTSLASDAQLYGFYFAWEENNDIVWGGYHYYYIDNKSEKTRYLYLDTAKNLGKGVVMVANEQMQFVIDSLTSLSEGWHVIPIAHLWYDYDEAVKAIPDYVQNILAVFDAYNGRTAGTVTHNGNVFTYNFTEAAGNVEFCIGGHVHADQTYYSTGGIPIFIIDADSTAKKGAAATLGTITEGCVTAVVADYNTRQVKLIRLGRGSDRTVTLPAYQPVGPAEIVNILNVYDVQYNKRYSPTNQGYKDANGVIAFSIPFADVRGKTIYFKGFSDIPSNSSGQVSAWYYVKDGYTTCGVLSGVTNSNVFTATQLKENNGVYSIAINEGNISDHVPYSEVNRLQIQMVLNSGTAVSATDLANCIMTIDQPIE